MADFMTPAPTPKSPLGVHRVLSSTAGVRVSPLIFGAMSIGSAWKDFMGSMDRKQAFDLLDAFFEAGGNLIDTANVYQDGQSEAWIGDWMHERGVRDQMVIATKFSFHYKAPSNADKTPANNNFWGNHRRSLHVSLRDSLAKLRTSWIDILYVHWWDFTTSIEEVMDSLHHLVQNGNVLYLGISDAPAWVVAAANSYARSHGRTGFSIYQGRWNILQRDLEREIIPMAIHYGMAIAPWNVLGGGRFQSAHQIARRQEAGQTGRGGAQQTQAEEKISEAMFTVAQSHGIDSVQAVAIAYVRAKAPNVFPIVGGRKVEQLHDNISALQLRLTDEEIRFLEGQEEFDVGFPGNFVGQDWKLIGKPSHMIAAQGPLAMRTFE